ncbi:MAG: tetratricopeptide repeat protein [Candidatus Eremiobacterota bacterium]
MSNIENFLKDLSSAGNQIDRIRLLRKNKNDITEELFWILHFYTTVFLIKGKWPQALELMELVMEVSDLINTMDLNLHSKYLQVSFYHCLGEFNRAENLLKERLNIHNFLKEWDKLADSYYQLGKIYIYKGNYNNALEALKKAREYYLKTKDEEKITSILLDIGEIYFTGNDFDKALIYFKEACHHSKKAGINSIEVRSLNWLGFIEDIMGNTQESLSKFQEASRKIKNPMSNELILSLASQARVLKNMGYYKEAFLYYRQILEIRREIDFKQALGKNLYYRGLILMNTGLPDRSYKCFREALSIFRQIGDWQTEMSVLFSIGIVRWKMGETIDSISFFIDESPEKDRKKTEPYIPESYAFSPVPLKYADRGVTEFHMAPYIGKIQYNSGIIYEYSQEGADKLFQLLEGFLGREQKIKDDTYIISTPVVNRKILQEELKELAMLSYQLGNYTEGLKYLKKVLNIILYRHDDNETSDIMEFIKEIYLQSGDYQKGVKFFSSIIEKACARKMERTAGGAYLFTGNLLVKGKRFSEAMLMFRKSLEIKRKIGERKPVIHALIELGKFHKAQKGYSISEKYFKEALEECNKGINIEEKLNVLQLVASLFTHQKKLDKAVETYSELARETQYLSDNEKKLSNILLAGNNCDFLGSPHVALNIYINGMSVAYKYKSTKWLCTFLEYAGRIYEDTGKYSKGEACFKYKLTLSEKEHMTEDIVVSLTYLSYQKFIKGHIDVSENLIEKSLKLAENINNKIIAWKTLLTAGRIKLELGKINEAYKHFLDSYNLATEGFPIESMEGASNFHLAITLYMKGKINQSLFYLREASRFYGEELKEENFSLYPRRKAHTYTCTGLISLMVGKTDEACKYIEMAMNLYKDMGLITGMAEAISTMGEIYQKRGDYEKGEKYFKEALILYKETGNTVGKIRTLNNSGRIYLYTGNYGKAKEYFEEILNNEKTGHFKIIYGCTMENMGYTMWCLNNHSEGIEKIKHSIALFQDMEYEIGIVRARKNSGCFSVSQINDSQKELLLALDLSQKYCFLNYQTNILFQLAGLKRIEGDYSRAYEYLVQVKEISQKIFRPDLSWKINFDMARLAMNQNRYGQAVSYYQKSIEEIENYFWFPLLDIREHNFHNTCDYREHKVYEYFIDYFLETGQNEEAFTLIERTKALKRSKESQYKNREKKEELFQKEREVIKNIKEIYYLLVNQEELETELMSELWTKYTLMKKTHKILAEKIIKKYPELKVNYSLIYMTVKDVKEKLSEEESVIEYYFTEKNTLIFFLYAAPEGFYTLKIGVLPVPAEHLRKNLPEELLPEEFKELFDYIKGKFPEMEHSKSVYYIIQNELKILNGEP